MRAERSGLGLNLNRLGLLSRLRANGAMTATALAAAERLQPQSLTRMLARLESDGLIVRRQDATDRRQVLIDVTQKGIAVLTEDTRRREEWLAEVMADRLSPIECEMLRLAAGLLDRLADD